MQLWTDEEIQILKNEYKYGAIEVARKLSRSYQSVRNKAKLLKLKSNYNRGLIRHGYNPRYFSSINLNASYWAGFISADGTITKDNRIILELCGKDKERLELFKSQIQFHGEILSRKKKPCIVNNRWVIPSCPHVAIKLGSAKQTCDDLELNYNIHAIKNNRGIPNNLDYSNSLAFIAGIIDGDGAVGLSNKGYPFITIRGSEKILLWIKDVFAKISPLIIIGSKYGGYSITDGYPKFSITGKRAVKVIKEILSLNLNLMPRKWSLFRTGWCV